MKKKITTWTSFFKSKQGKRLFLIVLFAGLIVLPFVSNTLVKRIASTIFIYSLLSMGNMVIGGFTGMLNLGHAAFWGVGAYITAILMTAYNVPFTIAFLASGIGTALVGLLIAIPCLRLATDFLSLITIAFSYVFLAIVRNWMSVTKGPQGIPGISCINFFGIDFKDPIAIYFVLLAITVLSYIIISNITKSKFGRAMQATRDDELGARSAGIKPNQIKILSFVIGTFFAGLAGALYAAYIGYIGRTRLPLIPPRPSSRCVSSAASARSPARSSARCSLSSCRRSSGRLRSTASASAASSCCCSCCSARRA